VISLSSTSIYEIENDRLALKIDKETCALTVLDKESGKEWSHPESPVRVFNPSWRWPGGDVCLLTPQTRKVEEIEGGARITLTDFKVGRWRTHPLKLTYEIRVDGNRVSLILKELENMEPEAFFYVEIPYLFGCGDAQEDGYLVLPYAHGYICEFNPEIEPSESTDYIYSGKVTMPFFGIVKGETGFAAVVKTPYDCMLQVKVNVEGRFAISPLWIFEEGRLNYQRRIDYFFLPHATYVDIAKTYRKTLIEEGRFVTLKEKIAKSPVVGKYLGAVTGEFRELTSFEKAKKFFETAHKKGFDRIIVFSTSIPRPWRDDEVDEDLLKKWKDLIKYIKSLSPEYNLTFYQNYVDITRGSPDWNESDKVRGRNGKMPNNWFTTYLTCTPSQVKRAQKHLPKLRELTGEGFIYLDVIGIKGLYECFDPKHPLTREDDAKWRREVIKAAKKIFEGVAVEGTPQDFLCDLVDMGAYLGIYPYAVMRPKDAPRYISRRVKFPVIPVPLFELIYHDSLLIVNPGPWTESSKYWLEDYACEPLHIPLYGLLPDDLSERSLRISKLLRETAFAEMVEHKFLKKVPIYIDEEGLYHTRDVQMTRFSDGTIVIANFSDEPYEHEDIVIAPHDFVIIKDGIAW